MCYHVFLINPLVQGHSENAPEASRDAYGTNQRTNEDDSLSDLHPEAGIFHNKTTRNSDPKDGQDSNSRRVEDAHGSQDFFSEQEGSRWVIKSSKWLYH